MSKKQLSFPLALLILLQILQFVNNSSGQRVESRVVIAAGSDKAEVTGSFSGPVTNPRNLFFIDQYAGVSGLGARISDLQIFAPNGETVRYKRFMSGEYVAEADYSSYRYKIDLKPLSDPTAGAHTSWLKGDVGILRPGDLLPNVGDADARVSLVLPSGWTLYPTGSGKANADIAKDKIDKTAFVIGNGWREKVDGQLHLVISGDWQFSDDDAAKLAAEVIRNYRKDLGSLNADDLLVAIAKFPVSVPIDNWEADTRGTSIVILSSDTPFKSQSLQRLHEQLRHEIFHLWIPNGVNLTGSYDWFYEGFALYQSLKLGVAVNRIRFDDYLDTLSRAYDIDRRWPGKMSLIEASNQRWNGSNTQVYARGMLVAFMCDLAMMEESGKTSTDLVRELYEKHRPPAAARDGNAAVLALMRQHPELVPVVDRNITGADTIDWQSLLERAGLTAASEGSETKLRVMPKLTGRQKDLLNRLGYNNWR
jgi:hypothetical protein